MKIKNGYGAVIYTLVLLLISVALWIGAVNILNPLTDDCGMFISNIFGLVFAFINRKYYCGDTDTPTYYIGSAFTGFTIPIMLGLYHLLSNFIEEEQEEQEEDVVDDSDV